MGPVEEEALRRIVPDAEEEARLLATIEDVLARVRERLEEGGVDATPMVVGSVAKGTHLTGTEVDVFVAFPPDTPRKELERMGLDLGAFLEDKQRMYAEHPYTRGRWGEFEVEVVPCYRIERADQRLSAVDRTPLHAAYVKERLSPEAADEVRLLKAFTEGIGVYGAEARVQGFSGYLCELLVLKYGGFRAVLEASREWRPGTVLELDVPAGRGFEEPLVVVDPVDAERNVASAVSEEQMAVFRHAAETYLKEPRLAFFFPPPLRPPPLAELRRTLRERGTDLLAVVLPNPEVTDDVLYPQLRKALRAMGDACARAGFRILRQTYAVAEAEVLFLYEFEVYRLPRAEKHAGPPAWVRNAREFRRKWRGSKRTLSGPYIEDGRWMVDVRRERRDARAFLEREIRRLSLGKNLDTDAKRAARFLHNDEVLRAPYRPVLAAFLDRRFPWERSTG